MDAPDLIITTTSTIRPNLVARAQAVAKSCGLPYIERHMNLGKLMKRHGVSMAYVVGPQEEHVVFEGRSLKMHPGLFYLKRAMERAHPFIKAVAPEGFEPTGRIIDGTLGLANDAIHLASILEVPIDGVEINPVIAALVEAGLSRIHAQRRRLQFACENIRIHRQDTLTYLQNQADKSADIVYVDPMFNLPKKAAPGFDILRRLACHRPLDGPLMNEARRVARHRVVVKVPGLAPCPLQPPEAYGFNRFVKSKAVDYYIAEMQSPTLLNDLPDHAQDVSSKAPAADEASGS